jgi:ribosomal protein S27AE
MSATLLGQAAIGRPAPAGHVDLPTYRLSDPRVRISRRCPSGCGDTVMAELPEGLSPGRVVCFGMCGRTFGWVLAL